MTIDLRVVRAGLREIRANPEDTEAGVRLMRAFGGEAQERRYWARVRMTREAGELLSAKPDLLGALADRAKLRTLPAGTLGHEYLAFAEREMLCPRALNELLETLHSEKADQDIAFLRAHSTALHDLLHVVTGYGRDSAGEIALMAFSGEQDSHRGAAWLSRLGCVLVVFAGRFDLLKLIVGARQRARRSPWLFAQDWLSHLDRPIDDIRKELGLWPVPQYQAMVSR